MNEEIRNFQITVWMIETTSVIVPDENEASMTIMLASAYEPSTTETD